MGLTPSSIKTRWNWWWSLGPLIATPALVLAMLGLRSITAERAALRDQQRQAARVADAALANAFAELEGRLRAIDFANKSSNDHLLGLPDAPIFMYEGNGLLRFVRERVYFGESDGYIEESLAAEQAQAAEAQGRTLEAETLYRRIATTEPKLGEWARLRLALIQRRRSAAEFPDVFADPEWGRSPGLSPGGLPVALIACANAGQLLSEDGALQKDEGQRFTPLLDAALESLRDGRWWLSYEMRRYQDREIREMLLRSGATTRYQDDAQLDELAAIDRIVRRLSPHDLLARFEPDELGSFLIIRFPSGRASDALIGVAIPKRSIPAAMDEVMQRLFSGQSYRAAIRDLQGDGVWGLLPASSRVLHTEELRSVVGLELAFSDFPSINRKQLLWYGFITLLVAMMTAGLVMTTRVVRREAELGRLQNEFIAAVSHEFKSPLTSVRLLLERITEGRLRTTDAMNEYHSAIGRELGRLEWLVARLLEAQQIQAGRKQYSFSPASIVEIVQAAIEQLRPQAEAKGICIEFRTADSIPHCRLDKTAIRDAIENLLDNAIKYSASGARVAIEVRKSAGEICIDLCDEGIGIERDELPHIFERFYRGRRGDRRDVKGTGLGLALVRAAVGAHGGVVQVDSAPGRGSRFSVHLPIERPDSLSQGRHD